MVSNQELQDIANILRRDVLAMTSKAGSGHPTSCLSCSELMSCLFFNAMNYDIKNANNPDNDEFILSKGHAAPILYSSLYHAGCINSDLLSLRRLSSALEGHPIPSSSLAGWIKLASGSLGQGLSVGIGYALAAKIQKRKFKTYVLLGDSEMAEGSVWEALQFASHSKLNNLVAIIDVNRLGQRGETMLGSNTKLYAVRLSSFGWNTIVIDGHNIPQILDALKKAHKSDKPYVIIAKTIKGKGVSFLEDKNGWHGKALDEKQLQKALKEIPNPEIPNIEITLPETVKITKIPERPAKISNYKLNSEVATRDAYGISLAELAKANQNIIALDGEVSNSTFSEKVKEKTPKQFIESYIAEQNMIGISLGLSIKGFHVFASTFGAFLTRAHDQIRMAAISQANINICGSHAGVSIGEDGPSQMALEDISMFRSLPNSIVLYPSDAVSAEKLVHLLPILKGVKYIRTTRPKTPVIYQSTDSFSIGDFKILKMSKKDKLVLAGAGITTHESIKAHQELIKKGVETAVIDLYSIKPFNAQKFIDFVKQHGNKLIVSEDHYQEGGIGEMLTHALANAGIIIKALAVKQLPHSGKKDELLDRSGISAKYIVEEAKRLV